MQCRPSRLARSHRLAVAGPAVLTLGCTLAHDDAVPVDAPARVTVEQAHGLVFVRVESPLLGPLQALLDTGASASAIDARVAADLDTLGAVDVLGTDGTVAAEVVRLDELRLGAHGLPTLRATRRDLGGLLTPPGADRVDMILGADAFRERRLTIDFEEDWLEVGPSGATGGVPLVLDDGIPAIPARLGGLELWLRIDTGASLFETSDVYVNVPQPVWDTLRGEDPSLRSTSSLSGTGAGGRTMELAVVPLEGARVGLLDLERVFLIVQPEAGYFARPDAKGFVSNNYLRRLGRVSLDLGARRMVAATRGGASGEGDHPLGGR